MTETDRRQDAKQTKLTLAKTAWRIVSILLTALAFAYIAYALVLSGASVAAYFTSSKLIFSILLGGFLYALTLQFVGAGWWQVLVSLGDRALDLNTALAIFGRTQIYKYLPTNVFHMAGRIAEARLHGVSTTILIIAQFVEFFLLASAAALVSGAFGWHLIKEQGHQLNISPMTIFWATALIGVVGVVAVRWARHRNPINKIRLSQANGSLALLCYSLFFVLNGVLLKILSVAVNGLDISVIQLMGIGAAAWLIGFIVPGAPGGLGVREAAMIAALSKLGVNEPAALALALSHRLSTVLGDAVVAVVFLFRER
ncbi:lysylphosphatidylglycerol synthase domain-containing protein [Rhizobium sp. G187]|uniref:lysylphosphatidylglycerol synthase domain-containing protein n=1 Tax=Rhizobium sp. G187 TaxID=3451352 RepID=UPI003EE62CE2